MEPARLLPGDRGTGPGYLLRAVVAAASLSDGAVWCRDALDGADGAAFGLHRGLAAIDR